MLKLLARSRNVAVGLPEKSRPSEFDTVLVKSSTSADWLPLACGMSNAADGMLFDVLMYEVEGGGNESKKSLTNLEVYRW